MHVSVIIPVYNAEQFIATAIDSALAESEVAEVLLIEDGSPDAALRICEEYAQREPRVKLLRHPNGENRGVSASRNLGITHASSEYVAFLDADDRYVPGRFRGAQEIFEAHPDAHGVYGHLGVVYLNPEYRERHLQRIPREISGMREYIAPGDLLAALLSADKGHISVDTLVVRRAILTEAFLFDPVLRMAEDTEFMWRLTAAWRLYSTESEQIVALRGVHGENSVFNTKRALFYRRMALRKCIRHKYYGCRDRKTALKVIHRYLKQLPAYKVLPGPQRLRRYLAQSIFLLSHPRIAIHLFTLD